MQNKHKNNKKPSCR